ncbi:MAG TPA: glycine betaine ABC transporter substrate-binding protein [Thermoleophilaceae bacterium]
MAARIRLRAAVTVTAAIALLAVAGCGGTSSGGESANKKPKPVVTLGTKNFAEQYLLGQLYAQALRARGFRVVVKEDIGASEIIHRTLQAGAIDMYPEYIGVLVTEVAHRSRRPSSAAQAYRLADGFEQGRGFTLLAPTPYSNTDALAVKPSYAKRWKLRTVADLAKVSGSVRLAAPPEFRTRFEGLVGLEQVYGLTNIRFVPSKIGEQYGELDKGKVDVADVFTTDGQLNGSRYTVLRDPKRIFGFQNVAPIVSVKTVQQQGSGFTTTIDRVSKTLTTQSLRQMNAEVMLKKRPPAQVAQQFLREHDLA